jgi:hypothetical protein
MPLIKTIYCAKCDKEYNIAQAHNCMFAATKFPDIGAEIGMPPIEDKPITEDVYEYNEKGSIHVASWNKAIEAAALEVVRLAPYIVVDRIRKLKK